MKVKLTVRVAYQTALARSNSVIKQSSMDCSKRVKWSQVNSTSPTKMLTLGSSVQICKMGKGSTFSPMGRSTMVNGKMGSKMDMVLKHRKAMA